VSRLVKLVPILIKPSITRYAPIRRVSNTKPKIGLIITNTPTTVVTIPEKRETNFLLVEIGLNTFTSIMIPATKMRIPIRYVTNIVVTPGKKRTRNPIVKSAIPRTRVAVEVLLLIAIARLYSISSIRNTIFQFSRNGIMNIFIKK